MKRKILSVLLTLVLVLSFSLLTATPVAAATTFTQAGSTIAVTSLAEPFTEQTDEAFDAEPHTTVVDAAVFDAQTRSQVTIEGAISDLNLGAGWPSTAYVEIGLRPEATKDDRNAGVYLIAFNVDSVGTRIHLQDYTGSGQLGGLIDIPTPNTAFRYKITLEPSVEFGGQATLNVWVGEIAYGPVTLPYGFASTWDEGVAGLLDENFSNAHLFYSIIAECRGEASKTYSATVGDITIDDTLYVGAGQQFPTIQAAINFANPGDTINVAAGVYSEWQDNGYGQSAGNIIDKPLHLQGSGDDCIIRGKTGTTSYMRYSPIVWVKADNVEIDHFKFDGATVTEAEPEGLRSYGIQSAWKVDSIDYAATNLNVHHNTFVFIGAAVTQDRAGGGNITVAYNNMVRETRSVWYKPAGAPGSYVDKTLGGDGVKFDYVVGGTVHDNTGIETPSVGIFLHGCDGLTIGPNNVVSAPNTTDPSDTGIHIQGCNNIVITGNTISNFTNGEDPYYNHGKKGAGIHITSGNNAITIEDNNLTNNSVGVYIGATAASPSPTNVKINSNNIEDNADYGVLNIKYPASNPWTYWDYELFSVADATIDATNNWWGHASGPQADEVVYTSYGDKVSSNVDYNPWLLEKDSTTIYDKTLALKHGWTLVSVDKAVAEAIGVGTNQLADGLPDETTMAFKYTPTGGFVPPTPGDLGPLTAIYVKTNGGGGVGFNYAADGDPVFYSKELEAGWNLISTPSTVAGTDDILSPLRYVTAGTQQVVGLTTLVSQGEYNQFRGSFYDATLTNEDWDELEDLIPFDGYWANMEAADTFEVIPVR